MSVKRIVIVLCGAGLLVGAVACVFAQGTAVVLEMPAPVKQARLQQVSDLKAMKASHNWKQMKDQLDQYDAHYTDATNKIAQVADADTRQALTKSLKAIDDCYDALNKLIKCFQNYVEAKQ